MKTTRVQVFIVGSGIAGLVTALSLPSSYRVLVISKGDFEECNSYLAQGGICVMQGPDDREAFIADTLRAGHGENDLAAVQVLVDESMAAFADLLSCGVAFTHKDGKVALTKEGAHSRPRIAYCHDQTGKVIMDALIKTAQSRNNIQLVDHTTCRNLLVADQVCHGGLVSDARGDYLVLADHTVLATGGLGGLFKATTNFSDLWGDGYALAMAHNLALRDLSYIQFHPTAFYEKKEGRLFLISEAVRGEGAVLRNHKGQEFTDSLQARDLVSRAIWKEMEREGVDHEFLDFSGIKGDMEARFPTIMSYVRSKGIEPREEWVPIVPAAHYSMGGIEVDLYGQTGVKNLYAVGEVASTGVHGRNRLASNSTLEAVVFGKRVAQAIQKTKSHTPIPMTASALPVAVMKERLKERMARDDASKASCP